MGDFNHTYIIIFNQYVHIRRSNVCKNIILIYSHLPLCNKLQIDKDVSGQVLVQSVDSKYN